MSWLFSAALAEACWAEDCSGGEPCVPLNTLPTPQAFSYSGRTIAASTPSRFGTTYEPLTAARGEALLTWYLAASRAKRSAAPLANNAEDLWPEMRRVVADVAPWCVFAENVAERAIDHAADDLRAMGYETRAIPFSAKDLGADHIRCRYWLLAYAHGRGELLRAKYAEARLRASVPPSVWASEPGSTRMADGMAGRLDRIAATGNGQVPCVAASAFLALVDAI